MASSGPVDTIKNAIGDPLGTSKKVLNTIDRIIPDWMVQKPGSHQAPQNDTSWHDQQVKSANETFGAKTPPAKPKGASPTPKYHKGTDYVPKTGPAILKKGEAVLNTEDASKLREVKMSKEWSKDAKDGLGGKDEKPPKEISHIVHHKMVGGGHHFEHHHTHPAHPVEHHFAKDDDGMVEHMLQHAGTPNPGEQEAEAGTPENYQPGASPNVAIEAAASPQAMGPAGGAPPAGGPQGA